MENPVITLRSQYLGGGLVRLDVLLAHAPRDLFGIAFHLQIEGGSWSLQQGSPGNVLFFLQGKPLFLASQSDVHPEDLIVGISSRPGDALRVQDGVVASFLVKGKEGSVLTAVFYDGHMRLSEQGQPELSNVLWQGSDIQLRPVVAHDLDASILASSQPHLPSVGLFDDPLLEVYGTMAAAFFLLLVGLMVFRLRERRRKKTLT